MKYLVGILFFLSIAFGNTNAVKLLEGEISPFDGFLVKKEKINLLLDIKKDYSNVVEINKKYIKLTEEYKELSVNLKTKIKLVEEENKLYAEYFKKTRKIRILKNIKIVGYVSLGIVGGFFLRDITD